MKQGLEKVLAKKWMIFLLFVSIAYLFGTKTDRRYGWTNENAKEATPIYSDGAGYYAFLPEWFIYEGNKFEFNEGIRIKYPNAGFEDNLSKNADGTLHDKYFTGTAQCLTPFFLIGHAHANAIGADTDGYSWPYLLWLNAGMITYGMIGFISLFLFLRRLKLDYFSCYIAIISLAAATNVSFYLYFDIPYSHVFSFATINLCLLQSLKWKQENKALNLVLFTFFLGLSFMIRPTNILIVLLIPFFFENNKVFIGRLKILFTKEWKSVLLGVVLFCIPVLVQVYSFYLQMGEVRLNSYSNEGFSNWKSPYMIEVLFGFRKGMFVYSPFLLLLFPGLVLLYFKNKRLFAGVLIFGLASTYALASWWCWWYGGSLGFRPMVDFYGVLVIPIAFLIHYSAAVWRILILAFIVFTAYVYQTYEFQYRKKIIHYDYMNYGMWKTVFMEEDSRFNFMFFSDIDTLPSNSVQIGHAIGFSAKNELLSPGTIYGYKGKNFFPENPFAGKYLRVKDAASSIGLRVTFKGYLNSREENPYVMTEYFKDGSLIGQKDMLAGWRFNEIKVWKDISVDIIPDRRWKEVDSVKCSLVAGKKALQFKNIHLRIFKFK